MEQSIIDKKRSTLFDTLRLWVIICFVIFFMMRRVTPLAFLADNQIIPGILTAASFLLLLWDMVTKRRSFGGKYLLLLVVFLGACTLSILLNLDIGIAGGVIQLGYYAIEFFFIYSLQCTGERTQRTREILMVNRLFIGIQLLYAIIAIGMFLFSIQFTYTSQTMGYSIEQGYQPQYERTWGIYYEANFLGIASLIAIIISWMNIRHAKKKIYIGIYAINILIQFLALVLSGSRTAFIALIVAGFIAGWYYSFELLKEKFKGIKDQLIRIAIGILCSLLCYMGIFTIVNIAPDLQKMTLIHTQIRSQIMSTVKQVYEYNNFSVDMEEEYVIQDDALSRQDLVGTDDTSNGRIPMWEDGIKIFLHKPLFGVSMRNAGLYAKEHNLSTIKELLMGGNLLNGYLEVLVGVGIVGFLILMLFLLQCLKRLYRYQRARHSARGDVGISLMIVAVLMVFIVFFSDVFYTFTIYSLLFWLYLGYGMGLIRNDEKNERGGLKAGFVCDTPYQVLNAINFTVNEFRGSAGGADLYLYHQFKNSEQISKRIRDSKLFATVYDVKPYKNNKAWYTKIRTLKRMVFTERTLKAHIAGRGDFVHKAYDSLAMSFFTHFTLGLRQLNPDANVLLLEDGTGSYFGNIEKDYRSGLFNFYNRLFMNGALDYHPQRLYVNNPALCTSTVAKEVCALPKLNENNPALKTIEFVFDYQDNSVYADKQIVYLTQPLNEVKNNIPGAHEAVLNELEPYRNETIVRLHPRQNKAATSSFAVDEVNNLWELECVHCIGGGHVLLAAFSTAQFAPKLLCDTEPYLIFLYKLFFTELDSEYWRGTAALIERFRALYRQPEKIFVPENVDEITNCLNQLFS